MTTIEQSLLEQALNALLLPCDRWNKQQFLIVKGAIESLNAALAAPATAPDERVKELEAELAATEIAIAEYRQQCLDNATEIARLRSESEERLQNCAALVAENEQLRWAVKDALAQLQRGDFADAESTLSVTAMKETP